MGFVLPTKSGNIYDYLLIFFKVERIVDRICCHFMVIIGSRAALLECGSKGLENYLNPKV